MLYRRIDGTCYVGDLLPGDREATAEEAAAWEASHVPTFATLKAAEVAYWKAEREKMIARMNSIQDQLSDIGDTAGAASCRALRQSLLGLFIDPDVVAATNMPTLKAAFKARYKLATDLATTSAKLEFVKYES